MRTIRAGSVVAVRRSPAGLTLASLSVQTASMRAMRLSACQCQAVWPTRFREGTTTRMFPCPAKCSAIRMAVIVFPVLPGGIDLGPGSKTVGQAGGVGGVVDGGRGQDTLGVVVRVVSLQFDDDADLSLAGQARRVAFPDVLLAQQAPRVGKRGVKNQADRLQQVRLAHPVLADDHRVGREVVDDQMLEVAEVVDLDA